MNEAIRKFFSSQAYAIAGVSRDSKKFGNAAFREMKKHNLTVYPVNPHLTTIENVPCIPDVQHLPDEVKSVVIVVHPEDAVKIMAGCHEKGIENIWLQKGAESDEAISYAKETGLNLIHGQCVLMFLQPVKGFHAFHRWVKKAVGSYPA